VRLRIVVVVGTESAKESRALAKSATATDTMMSFRMRTLLGLRRRPKWNLPTSIWGQQAPITRGQAHERSLVSGAVGMARIFEPAQHVTSWRRLAPHVWDRPHDPTVYGVMDLVSIGRFRISTSSAVCREPRSGSRIS
jgi:hypothetical protein